jgi:hypothetical protein
MALAKIEKIRHLNLSEKDWMLMEDIVALLDPFEDATKLLCGDKYQTIGHVIPTLKSLAIYANEIPLKTEKGKELRERLIQGCQTRFAGIESNPTYAISTILCPQYKMAGFSNQANAEIAKNTLFETYNDFKIKMAMVSLSVFESID